MTFIDELNALLKKWFGNSDTHVEATTPSPGNVTNSTSDFALYEDGSVSSPVIDAYLDTYAGKDKDLLIRNYFFVDNATAIPNVTLTKVQNDNIRKNVANVHGPGSNGIMSDAVDSMMYAQSAVIKDNGLFDPRSDKTLPYARASRKSVHDIPAIVASWQSYTPKYYPKQIV